MQLDLSDPIHSIARAAARGLDRRRSTPRAIAAATVVLVILGACSHRAAPTPAPASPPPVPVSVTAAPAPASSWTLPLAVASTRYLIEVTATLERDSAGRALQEHVESRAIVSLQTRRDSLGGFRANGLVDSFTVRGLERALAPAGQETAAARTVPVVPELPLVVAFDAVLDARTLRVITRPPLPNECDRPESGATNLVRELLVRVPRTVGVGMQWSDSTVGFLCRLGVPITSRTRADYRVERAEKVQDRTELVVRRAVDTQLDGLLRSPWRTMTVAATGRGTQTIRVDAATGAVRSIDGESTLTVRLTDSARRDGSGAQEVRQTARSRTVLRP